MSTFDYTIRGFIYRWVKGGRFCDMDLTLPELDDIAEALANIAWEADVTKAMFDLEGFLDYRKQYVRNVSEAPDYILETAAWVDRDFKTLCFTVDQVAYRIVQEAGFTAFVTAGFRW